MARLFALPAATMEPDSGFSLVIGGPLYQLLMRGRLCDPALHFVRRRLVLAILLLWLPLLILSQAQFLGSGRIAPGFLGNVGFHLRFLVVVPLLILAELVVHARLRPLVEQFRIRGLLAPGQSELFDRALAEAMRLRNSVAAETLLLIAVYLVGVPTMARRFALQPGLWHVQQGLPGWGQLSPAGWWLVLVSLPLFQFLLCRWYFRLFVWARFLWRVSRLELRLEPTHPDRAGGLGFLGASLQAFVPIAVAHGVLLAGVIADRILFAGASLVQFKIQLIVAILLLLLLFAGPLVVFAPLLARVKRLGLIAYGGLAQTYVRAFDRKWRAGEAPADEPFLGSGDIQSLADLGNAYVVVEQMRLVPLSRMAVIQFVAAILAPVVPLVFTMMSLDQLLAFAAGMVI